MARLMITCPSTKKPVFTGIAMDRSSYDSSTMMDNSVGCPYCGQMHRWDKKDSFLEGEKK